MTGRHGIAAKVLRTGSLFLTLAFAVSACGGDGGTAPDTTVASVTVMPDQSSIEVDGTVQLQASVKNASGDVLDGKTVTWDSEEDGIATVSNSGLVTGVSGGTTTITATSEGVMGTAEVEVMSADFAPTSNTQLSGVLNAVDVNIPAGVTVTVTGDLVINATGDVTIDGNLAGDCVSITINGGGNATITGTVDNGCADGTEDLPGMTIIADGDITVDGATFLIAGDFEMRNDPDLTENEVPESPAAAPAQQVSSPFIGLQPGSTWQAKPPRAKDGSDGQHGGNGRNAHTWRMLARGTLIFGGNVSVIGQDGGNGGNGEHESDTAADANGGNGGDGGKLRVLATGQIIFGGSGNTLESGDGGDGGWAAAQGLVNPTPAQAASADAEGGDGGDPGLVEVRSGQGIQVSDLTIRIGGAGSGGFAYAIAADGVDAAARPGGAQVGGNASARGGDSGDTPNKTFHAAGNILGAGDVDVVGGSVWDGGAAVVEAGDGGDGDEMDPDGAAGGNATAVGGDGGDANLKDQDGQYLADGGDGGDMEFGEITPFIFLPPDATSLPSFAPALITLSPLMQAGGNGGDGWSDCVDPNYKAGGDGGDGGDASATKGSGGTGKTDGDQSDIDVTAPGFNGGDGGDGEGPGDGGKKGNDGIGMPRTEHGAPLFMDGADGLPCKSGVYLIQYTTTSDPDNHEPFLGINLSGFFDVQLTPPAEGEECGTITITNVFDPNWPVLTGTWCPDTGEISLTGMGDFADGVYPDITIHLDGTLFCNNTMILDLVMDGFPMFAPAPLIAVGIGEVSTSSPPRAGVSAIPPPGGTCSVR